MTIDLTKEEIEQIKEYLERAHKYLHTDHVENNSFRLGVLGKDDLMMCGAMIEQAQTIIIKLSDAEDKDGKTR